jgi:hypothetical protein
MFAFNFLGLDAKVKTFFYFFMVLLKIMNKFLSIFEYELIIKLLHIYFFYF